MIVVGLTGSLAMGKTTVARMFADLGVPVFESDSVVHNLLKNSVRVKKAIKSAFPNVFEEGNISRLKLGNIVFENPKKLRHLENILHPPFMTKLHSFIQIQKKRGASVIILDVPLLFETGIDNICDIVVVVTADPGIQRKRAIVRSDMTKDRFKTILARQISDQQKQDRADYIISTNGPKNETRRSVERIYKKIISKKNNTGNCLINAR